MSASPRSGRREMKENLCRPGGVISTHLCWTPASRQDSPKRWSGLWGWARGGATKGSGWFWQPFVADNLCSLYKLMSEVSSSVFMLNHHPTSYKGYSWVWKVAHLTTTTWYSILTLKKYFRSIFLHVIIDLLKSITAHSGIFCRFNNNLFMVKIITTCATALSTSPTNRCSQLS